MRLTGYCTECHRIKQVQVTGHALVMAQARRSAVRGICAACQQAEDDKRKADYEERRRRP